MVATRTASAADLEAVTALWRAANEGRQAELGLPLGPVVEGGAPEVRARLGQPGSIAVLAEDGDDVVAMAIVLQALDLDAPSPDPVPGLAHIAMVAVRPDRWGSGLGEVVLAEAQRVAGQRGYDRAQLWTHEANRRAQRLYERLGWVRSGRTKADDRGEPILHYERLLATAS